MIPPELPKLTIRDVTLRAVRVPMAHPLVTRVVTIENMALLLIDLTTEEGVTGRTYLFGYTERGTTYLAPLVRDLVSAFRGEAIDPVGLYAKGLKALTLFGHEGLTLMALSGVDMACWDALARAAGMPLAALLGGGTDPVPAYNSNGLGLTDDMDALADEARRLVDEADFKAVKLRLGRETWDQDLAALKAVRDAVGAEVTLPVDFNQGLDLDEALRRGRALDSEGVYWIEEPIVFDDLEGSARLAAELQTPIQIGENFYGPRAMSAAIEAKACDYVMPDLERIGGVTGWLCAAAIADDARVPMSSHLFPEVSAHAMAATPTAHWLEYCSWANLVLETPLRVAGGHAHITEAPGTGLDWNEDAVARYRVDL